MCTLTSILTITNVSRILHACFAHEKLYTSTKMQTETQEYVSNDNNFDLTC